MRPDLGLWPHEDYFVVPEPPGGGEGAGHEFPGRVVAAEGVYGEAQRSVRGGSCYSAVSTATAVRPL